MHPTPRFALVYGFWGQNIGNAFFNLGGATALRRALSVEPFLVQDQPAYWTFRNEAKGPYARAYPMLEALDCDLVVLQGPVFTPNFGNIWAGTLKALARRKIPWAGIGVGLRKYDRPEGRSVAEVLRAFPPAFLSTRDIPTYTFLTSLGLPNVPIHDGIDSGFYVRQSYTPPQLIHAEPILCLTFDHYPEPQLVPDPEGSVEFGGLRFSMSIPTEPDGWARFGKAIGLARQTLQRGPRSIDKYGIIIRPHHRTNPHLPATIYARSNSLASDEPYTYLAVYSSASLTISDRVHACVATLSYGGRAVLYNPVTKRSALFDRVGCSAIHERPVTLNGERIDNELDSLERFIRAQWSRLSS